MQFFWNMTPGHWNKVTEVSFVIAASFFRIKESNHVKVKFSHNRPRGPKGFRVD